MKTKNQVRNHDLRNLKKTFVYMSYEKRLEWFTKHWNKTSYYIRLRVLNNRRSHINTNKTDMNDLFAILCWTTKKNFKTGIR